MDIDLEKVGKRVKEIYGVDGIAKDGRKYGEIPDQEMGSMYIRVQGADKAFATLGLGDPEAEKEKKKQSASLRKEFRDETKNTGFKEVQKQWSNMQSAGETGGGDISIMYSYIKMLDPTTAVREGELALGDAAAGLPDRVVKAYNKAVKTEGKGLAPEQRKQFVAEGAKIYNNAARKQQELNQFYKGLAIDTGVDPNDVIGTVGEIELAEIPDDKKVEGKGPQTSFERFLSGKGLPVTGAAIGATVGGLLGGVPAVGGAAAGYAGGDVLRKSLLDLLGARQGPQTMREAVSDVGETTVGAGKSALLTAVGLGAGKLVGKAVGLRGKLATARNVLSEGVEFGKQKMTNAVAEALRLNPGAAKEGELALKQIANAKDVKDLFKLKDIFNKFGFTRGGGIKSTKAADFYATLSRSAGEVAQEVAPEASRLHGLLRVSHRIPEVARKTATEGIRYGALARLFGL